MFFLRMNISKDERRSATQLVTRLLMMYFFLHLLYIINKRETRKTAYYFKQQVFKELDIENYLIVYVNDGDKYDVRRKKRETK